MKYYSIILFLFISLSNVLAQSPSSSAKEEEIQVIVGIDIVNKLDFRPSTKVEVGNENILTFTLIPDDQIREITLKGIKPGKTSVIIRDTSGKIKKRYRVSITSNDQSKTVIKLREFFDDIEGVSVGIKGGFVVVDGKLVVPSDIGRMAVILNNPDFAKVVSLVELSPQTQRIIANRMQEEINKAGIKNVTVRVINKQYWLEGFVTKKGDIQLSVDIAKGFLPDKLDNLAVVTGSVAQRQDRPEIVNFISENIKTPPAPTPKMVKIVAQFVELTKDYQKVFGFKWVPTLAGQGGNISFGKSTDGGVTTKSNGTLSGTIANLFPKLASAKSSGNARLIQQGMVITMVDTDASINKTTSIPFTLGTGEFQKSQDAKAGFDLNVKAKILAEQNIQLQASLGVSISTGSPPTTTSNNIKTSLLIKSGESAVIGGVSVHETNTGFDKDPPNGQDTFEDSSPLFSFIRSKSYVNNKSQYVVFATPQIIESSSIDTAKIKRKFRRRRR